MKLRVGVNQGQMRVDGNSSFGCFYLANVINRHVTILVAHGNLVTRMRPPQTVK